MNRTIRQTVLPVLAALIWGMAFSAQSIAADYIQPLTFNFYRCVIAFFSLWVVDLAASKATPGRKHMLQLNKRQWKRLLLGGGLCGVAIALGTNLQQLGLADTSPGKAGFITAMYIVIVPVLGLFQKKKVTPLLWTSVAIAVAGLYFLCVTESFTVVLSDLYVLICAVMFAVHILIIDYFSTELDGIQMSCIQFLTAGIIAFVGMLLWEQPSLAAIGQCVIPILYTAVLSSAVGYTLQIIAQKDANPTVVSLLLSLESVFAAVGGALLLNEQMGPRELLGCGLMMVAVVLAQLPVANRQ